MKILILGAKGFIGSNLAYYLTSKGHQLTLIDNFSHPSLNPIQVQYGDIRYYNDIAPHILWCDVCVLLSAQIHVDKSISNPEETMDVNVKGTLNVLEACRKYDKRLIFASSSEVYGTSQCEHMSETHQLDAQSVYAASKVAGDRLCKSYFDTYGTRVTILRNFNTFGPWQNDGSYGGVISIFTRKALKGEDLTIFGDGEQSRDYMFIDDCIQAYDLCLNNEKLIGQVINCGTGKTVSINKLAEMIVRLTQSNSKIRHIEPRAGEVRRLCADTTKAQSFGFKSTTDFERDLRSYIGWYKRFNNL